ncbi:MAG: AAA family ATPase [Thermoplasmatota archaeon]
MTEPASPRLQGLSAAGLFPAGKMVGIIGKQGGYKSITLLEILTAESTAFNMFKLAREGPVLLIAGEDRPNVERILAERSGASRVILAPPGLKLDNKDHQKLIRDLAVQHRVCAVAVDSLGYCLSEGLDENQAKDITRAISPLIALRNELGLTVIIVVHQRKNAMELEDLADRARGSGQIVGSLDLVLFAHRHGKEGCGVVEPWAKRIAPSETAKPFLFELGADRRCRWLCEYDREAEEDAFLLELLDSGDEPATINGLIKGSGGYYRPEALKERLRSFVERGLAIREGFAWWTPQGEARAEVRAADDHAAAKEICDALDGYPEIVMLLEALGRAAGFVTQDELGEKLDCSVRTIGNRLEGLQDLMRDNFDDRRLIDSRRNKGTSLTALGKAVAAALERRREETRRAFDTLGAELDRLDNDTSSPSLPCSDGSRNNGNIGNANPPVETLSAGSSPESCNIGNNRSPEAPPSPPPDSVAALDPGNRGP